MFVPQPSNTDDTADMPAKEHHLTTYWHTGPLYTTTTNTTLRWYLENYTALVRGKVPTNTKIIRCSLKLWIGWQHPPPVVKNIICDIFPGVPAITQIRSQNQFWTERLLCINACVALKLSPKKKKIWIYVTMKTNCSQSPVFQRPAIGHRNKAAACF